METENLFSSEHAAKTMSLIADKAEAGTPLTEDEQQFIEAFEKACPYIKAFNDKMDELQLTNEERHVLNFLLKANEPDRLNEMDMNTFMVLQLISMDFVHDHKDEVLGLHKPEERERLLTLLTKEFAIEKMGLTVPEKKLNKLQEKYAESQRTVDDVLDIIGFGNAIHLLYGTPSLPVVSATAASDHVWATDKAANAPFTTPGIYDVEKATIRTSKLKDKPGPDLTIQVKELEEKGLVVSGVDRLNRFDRAVHDAANSLQLDGNKYISPSMIIKHYSYASETPHPTKDMQDKAIKSMDKLISTWLRIDANREAKAKGLDKLVYEGYIISARKVTAIINGQETVCYEMLQPSMLYDYANRINRIGRCPTKSLYSSIEKNEESVILQDEIHRHVFAAKNSKSHMQPIIKFSTLYEILGVHSGLPKTAALRKKKAAIRKKVTLIFDGLMKQQIIKSYEFSKKGQEMYSVNFTF